MLGVLITAVHIWHKVGSVFREFTVVYISVRTHIRQDRTRIKLKGSYIPVDKDGINGCRAAFEYSVYREVRPGSIHSQVPSHTKNVKNGTSCSPVKHSILNGKHWLFLKKQYYKKHRRKNKQIVIPVSSFAWDVLFNTYNCTFYTTDHLCCFSYIWSLNANDLSAYIRLN